MAYAEVIAALADPTRRGLFEVLSQRPRSVTELVARAAVSQPAVSQHLKVLREAGLISVKVAGNRRIYHVNPGGLEALGVYVNALWERALSDFERRMEEEA